MAKLLTKEERKEIRRTLRVRSALPVEITELFDRYEVTIQALEAELACLNAQVDRRWMKDLDEGFPMRQNEG